MSPRAHLSGLWPLMLIAILSGLVGCGSTAVRTAPRGTVRFSCNVADATLEVNETRLGPVGMFTEHGILLLPGEHRVHVHRDGYFPAFSLIEVTANQVQVVDVQLRAVPD